MRPKYATASFFLILSVVLINCPHGSCKKKIMPKAIGRENLYDDIAYINEQNNAHVTENDDDTNSPETDDNVKLDVEEEDDELADNDAEALETDGPEELANDNPEESGVNINTKQLANDYPTADTDQPLDDVSYGINMSCWVTTNVNELYKVLDDLDEKYSESRSTFHKNVLADHMDDKMLTNMLETRGAAFDAIAQAGGYMNDIPSGLNIGGYSMMRLENSLLFFYRVKLRNDTYFRVDFLKNDVFNMVLMARINLNDLHLIGAYERSIVDRDPTKLFYQPTYGEAELLLKNVNYKLEGRYRLVQGQLWVEHVVSELRLQDMLMKYAGNLTDCDNPPEKLPNAARDEFVHRLKICLDVWMKDYFNDCLREHSVEKFIPGDIPKYEKEKTLALNDFVDNVVSLLKKRLHEISPPCANVKVADFTIFAVNGIQIKLFDGVLRGLDSMYRQSIATTSKTGNTLRVIDAVIAFSNLKLEYKYKALLPNHTEEPPVVGLFVLSADELVTGLKISTVRTAKTIDVLFSYLNQTRGLDLIVEGLLNRKIANFKHLLENQLITLMLNEMISEIRSLESITSCTPSCVGHLDPGQTDNPHSNKYVDGSMDYRIIREDSIEFEVPVGHNQKVKKMHLKYREQLNLTEKERARRRMRKKNIKNKNKKLKPKKKKGRH